MIILSEIAEKVSAILNGTDQETNQARTYVPDFEYLVATQGFHLDHIFNKSTGKNMIPVFISSLGGTNNPVPDLKQSDATVQIAFYFPVKFKDEFYNLADQMGTWFVGKILNYGTHSGRALSNLSLPNVGEIQELDLKEFKQWVGSIYRRTIDVTEPYMSLVFTLYLNCFDSTNTFIGNQIKITSLTFSYNGTDFYEDKTPISIERADIASLENASQQILNQPYVKGYPANLGYTRQLPLILKENSGYKRLLEICEKTKDVQNLRLTIKEIIPFPSTALNNDDGSLEITHTYYVTGYSRKTAMGQLVGIQLTLADVGEVS